MENFYDWIFLKRESKKEKGVMKILSEKTVCKKNPN